MRERTNWYNFTMNPSIKAILALCLSTLGVFISMASIHTAKELYDALYVRHAATNRFDITGKIIGKGVQRNNHMGELIVAGNGSVNLFFDIHQTNDSIRIGDVIRARGCTLFSTTGKLVAKIARLEVLQHEGKTTPVLSTIRDMLQGQMDFQLAQIRAVVREASRSAANPHWAILGLVDNGNSIAVPVLTENCDFNSLEQMIGQEVLVTGCCSPNDASHTNPGRQLRLYGTNDIQVVKDGLRQLPTYPLSRIGNIRPAAFDTLGLHSVSGAVLAVWNRRHALVRTAAGKLVRATFQRPIVPEPGAVVNLVGFPESDFYNINLIHAAWSPAGEPPAANAPSTDAALSDFFVGNEEYLHPNQDLYGKVIRIRSRIFSVPSQESDSVLLISADKRSLPVRTERLGGLLADLTPGCEIEVSGVCVIEVGSWHGIRPVFNNVMIVPRSASDVRIIRYPPWWTTRRLTIVIGVLLALLVGLVIRYRVQQRTAAMLSKIKTGLKVEERTRLAVELHDSLAQNLTGVALEIDTANKLTEMDHAAMRAHLKSAARSLKSCRDELRNCLWDLRNRALEEPTMDAAIRQTLAPHVAGIDLTVRFTVPRERISDNTAHALLRIIRELALNGIRHGGATKIRVVGSIENNKMLFSVSDNGSGFDPETAPGFSEGHYGLVGIRERIDEFEGDFTLKSTLGKGTKATIALIVPKESSEAVKRQST